MGSVNWQTQHDCHALHSLDSLPGWLAKSSVGCGLAGEHAMLSAALVHWLPALACKETSATMFCCSVDTSSLLPKALVCCPALACNEVFAVVCAALQNTGTSLLETFTEDQILTHKELIYQQQTHQRNSQFPPANPCDVCKVRYQPVHCPYRAWSPPEERCDRSSAKVWTPHHLA